MNPPCEFYLQKNSSNCIHEILYTFIIQKTGTPFTSPIFHRQFRFFIPLFFHFLTNKKRFVVELINKKSRHFYILMVMTQKIPYSSDRKNKALADE